MTVRGTMVRSDVCITVKLISISISHFQSATIITNIGRWTLAVTSSFVPLGRSGREIQQCSKIL